MTKLTKHTIDSAEPKAREFFLWDESVPGFGLRVMPRGRESFVVQYQARRRRRRMSLGPSTILTCDQARTRAITIIAAVKNGEYPADDRAAKRNGASVDVLADRFDLELISVPLKPRTAKEYRGNLKCFILPAPDRLAVTEPPVRRHDRVSSVLQSLSLTDPFSATRRRRGQMWAVGGEGRKKAWEDFHGDRLNSGNCDHVRRQNGTSK